MRQLCVTYWPRAEAQQQRRIDKQQPNDNGRVLELQKIKLRYWIIRIHWGTHLSTADCKHQIECLVPHDRSNEISVSVCSRATQHTSCLWMTPLPDYLLSVLVGEVQQYTEFTGLCVHFPSRFRHHMFIRMQVFSFQSCSLFIGSSLSVSLLPKFPEPPETARCTRFVPILELENGRWALEFSTWTSVWNSVLIQPHEKLASEQHSPAESHSQNVLFAHSNIKPTQCIPVKYIPQAVWIHDVVPGFSIWMVLLTFNIVVRKGSVCRMRSCEDCATVSVSHACIMHLHMLYSNRAMCQSKVFVAYTA